MADKDTGDLKALNLAGTTLLELIKLQKQADGPISGASAHKKFSDFINFT
jgi:hypothetical protein